jgi:hypothetical protein
MNAEKRGVSSSSPPFKEKHSYHNHYGKASLTNAGRFSLLRPRPLALHASITYSCFIHAGLGALSSGRVTPQQDQLDKESTKKSSGCSPPPAPDPQQDNQLVNYSAVQCLTKHHSPMLAVPTGS